MFESLLFNAVLAYFGVGLAGFGYLIVGTSVHDTREVKRQKLRQLHPYAKQNRYRPHITIIIPVYNASNSILACLNNVFLSTYRNKYDVIVIDMGSTDQTKKIVKAYIKANSKKPLKLIVKPKTTNILSTINKVISNDAVTEMVLTLDASHTVNKNTLRLVGQHYNESSEFNLVPNFEVISQPTFLSLIEQYFCVVSSGYGKLKPLSVAHNALPLGTIFRPIVGSGKITKLSLKSKKSMYISDTKIYKQSSASYSKLLSGYLQKNQNGCSPTGLIIPDALKRKRASVKHVSVYNLIFYVRLCMIAVTPFAAAYFIFLALNFNQPVWSALMWALVVMCIVWCIWTNNEMSLRTKSRLSFFVPIMPSILYLLNLCVITLKLVVTTTDIAKSKRSKFIHV